MTKTINPLAAIVLGSGLAVGSFIGHNTSRTGCGYEFMNNRAREIDSIGPNCSNAIMPGYAAPINIGCGFYQGPLENTTRLFYTGCGQGVGDIGFMVGSVFAAIGVMKLAFGNRRREQ